MIDRLYIKERPRKNRRLAPEEVLYDIAERQVRSAVFFCGSSHFSELLERMPPCLRCETRVWYAARPGVPGEARVPLQAKA